MESIFLTLSTGGAILSIFLALVSCFLTKERVTVHAIIVSIFLILFKIAIIVAIFIIEIHVVFRIIVIINSVTLIGFWGFVLWISIIQLKELNKKKKD